MVDIKKILRERGTISKFDGIILSTNHDAFDYGLIIKNSKLIVDTRGVYPYKSNNVVNA